MKQDFNEFVRDTVARLEEEAGKKMTAKELEKASPTFIKMYATLRQAGKPDQAPHALNFG